MHSPVIFITGAGKGLGQACVQELLQRASILGQGFRPRFLLTSRTKTELDSMAATIKSAGFEATVFAADLADSPLGAFEACLKTYERVDICLHSAGVGRFKNFLELTRADLEFVMRTNVEASFILMQAIYAQMKKQKSGLIEWITSVAAEKPFEQSAVYCMSKYAQHGLIEVMRLYGYQDNVRIIEVKPGAAFTPMWGEVERERRERMMDARDVAQAMVDAIFIPSRTVVEEITIRPVGGDL